MKPLKDLGITPAPWMVEEYCDSSVEDGDWTVTNGNVTAEDGSQVIPDDGSLPSIADARLIAAAPELYEALREAREWVCFDCRRSPADCVDVYATCPCRRFNVALAKARGESAQAADDAWLKFKKMAVREEDVK